MVFPVVAPVATGETVLFWVVAPLMVLAAIGVATFRKAVHAALCMIAVMLGLALLYVQQGALFMGVVQVVVYTGAIMMMILFVIMMVGIASSDNYRKTSGALRSLAWFGGVGLIVLLSASIVGAKLPVTGEMVAEMHVDNPVAVGISIFRDHTFSLILADLLLITAVVGSMLLNHADRLIPKQTQIETLKNRWNLWRTRGEHIGQLPAPGVYSSTNAVDVPAVSGETGAPIPESVSRVLRARGLERNLAAVEPMVIEKLRDQQAGKPGLHGGVSSRSVKRSGATGMPGKEAPTGLHQKTAGELVENQEQEGQN